MYGAIRLLVLYFTIYKSHGILWNVNHFCHPALQENKNVTVLGSDHEATVIKLNIPSVQNKFL
jgi:hypothetical protein